MAQSLRFADRARYSTDPNPRVGCVLVKDAKIVGAGWHKRAGGAHAEIMALEKAGVKALGATAYVTLEPCCHHGKTPPCTEALINARVSKVIAAMYDPNPKVGRKGLELLTRAGIETNCGLLAFDAEILNRGFCKRMRTGKPYVVAKLAMSMDGRTAMASGESQWITGEAARQDVHRLRARSGAVVTGIGTVISDNPSLTARLGPTHDELVQPVRVIVDSALRMPTNAIIGGLPGKSFIATVITDPLKKEPLEKAGFEIVSLPAGEDGRVQLAALIDFLGVKEINEVLLEAGSVLSGGMLQSRLIDELVVYMAPVVLGDAGRGLFHVPEIKRISEKVQLQLVDVRQIGQDLRLGFAVKPI